MIINYIFLRIKDDANSSVERGQSQLSTLSTLGEGLCSFIYIYMYIYIHFKSQWKNFTFINHIWPSCGRANWLELSAHTTKYYVDLRVLGAQSDTFIGGSFYLRECEGEAHTNKHVQDVRICITTMTFEVGKRKGHCWVHQWTERSDKYTTYQSRWG